jgi:basic membrane protein A
MKKYIAIISALVFVFTIAFVGCEKKQEVPKPAEQPAMTPPPPAPAPIAPAPAPKPAPAKPAKK